MWKTASRGHPFNSWNVCQWNMNCNKKSIKMRSAPHDIAVMSTSFKVGEKMYFFGWVRQHRTSGWKSLVERVHILCVITRFALCQRVAPIRKQNLKIRGSPPTCLRITCILKVSLWVSHLVHACTQLQDRLSQARHDADKTRLSCWQNVLSIFASAKYDRTGKNNINAAPRGVSGPSVDGA